MGNTTWKSKPAIVTPDGADKLPITDVSANGNLGVDFHVTLTQIKDFINSNGVLGLTSAEVSQLANIDTEGISNAQWGYLGELDQSLLSTASPTFNEATLTALKVGGSASLTGVSTGAGDNDKLVTQGYVDDGLSGKEDSSNKNSANGYAGLDAGGKISSSQIPDLAISVFLGNFTDTTAALADGGVQASQRGDWFTVDTNGGESWIVTSDNPTLIGDITQLKTPTGAVTSVFTRTGAITAQSGDYTADQITETASNKILTSTERTNIGTSLSHVTSDGSDHTFINQNVTTTGTPTFTSVTAATVQNTGDLALGFDGDTLTLSEASGTIAINPSQPVVRLQTQVVDTRTTWKIQGGPVSATGGDARQEFVHGNGTAFTRYNQLASQANVEFSGFSNYIINSSLAAVNTIIRGDTDANALRVNIDDSVTVGAGATADSAKFYVSGKISTSGELEVNGDLNHDGSNIGFNNSAPVAKGTITGSRASNAALTSLLTYLASRGDFTDNTTA